MHAVDILLSAVLVSGISTLSVPYVQDVYLQSRGMPVINFTTLLNSSCQECLCEQLMSPNNTVNVGLNCLANGTCQFFSSFPISYKLVASSGSRFYFLRRILPDASKCCMPNITELIIRLQNAVPITMSLMIQPAAFGYDANIPSEVAVIGWDPSSLSWFNPLTMTVTRSESVSTSLTVAVYNNQTFTASDSIPTIHIRDKQTNGYLGNITYPTLTQVRKLIFLDDGQTLLVSTQDNKSLSIFNINSPTNYTFLRQIELPVGNAHGIAKINDTFLYVSSWADRRIASCHYENLTWTAQVFLNQSTTSWGSHLAVDECERVWFINTEFGLRVYDSDGMEVATWNLGLNSSNFIYDILLLPDYVILVSYVSEYKVVRYDPQVTC